MSNENAWPIKRKFPRIVLPKNLNDLHRIIGVNASVISGPNVPVLDLSYGGAALEMGPSSDNHKIGDKIGIQFLLEDQMLKPITSEIVRISGNALGVSFKEMTPETRLGFDQIIKDKMIGLNTYQIRTDLLNPFERRLDLSCWFHGPRDTNIFIWQRHGHIDKAVIEYDYYLIHFESGLFKISRTEPDSELESDGYVAYFEKTSAGQELIAKDLEVLKRIVGLISQIPVRSAEIGWLMDILLGKLKVSYKKA
ncbi:MAG: PilZ domain-containing protein [Pseudomonadota bacterium]|nr:PilZ domain-containing protein [Pseudomonadota bacterium]